MERLRIQSDDGDVVVIAIQEGCYIPGSSERRLGTIHCETRQAHFSRVDANTFRTTDGDTIYRVIERL